MTPRASDLSLYFLLNLPCHRDPVALAKQAVAGGVTAIQLRGKESTGRELYQLSMELLPWMRARGVAWILNDRLDVALAVGADGVHLGRDDLPVEVARRLAPGLLLGASCYGDVERAREMAKQGADYLAFGSFYPSPTKPHAPQISLEVLEQARSLQRPLVAIGGITPARVAELCLAGAHGVAVISAIQNADSPKAAAEAFALALDDAKNGASLLALDVP